MPDLNPQRSDPPQGGLALVSAEYLANLQRLVNAFEKMTVKYGDSSDAGLKIAPDFSQVVLVIPKPGSSDKPGGVDLTKLTTRTVGLCNPEETVQIVIQG